MTLITFKMPAYPNLRIETMIAKTLELRGHLSGTTRAGKKINRPDQKKGG
jgi:hypothetical protein